MMSIIFRHAKISDIDSIYTIFSLTDQLHRESHPEIFQALTSSESAKRYYRESIQALDRTIIIAEDHGKVVGAVLCTVQSTSDIPIFVSRTYGCIENITVHKSYQGKGIGERLMLQGQKWAQNRGATIMELTVWEFNQHAQHFYDKLGYRTTRRRMVKELK